MGASGLMEGTLLGDYLLGSKIGEGGQASIIFAEHIPSNEFVALKVFPLSRGRDRRGFQNETEALAKLQGCSNVVKGQKSFQVDDQGIIVLERMKCDLLSLVTAKPISEKHCVSYFKQLCVAVKCMHDMQMAHMDIKIENCLIDGRGNVKLCDFGNAMSFQKDQYFRGRRGTRGYACPEMMDDEPFCPKQADMWSLGVTFHVMLTGCFPFNEEGGATFATSNLCTFFNKNPNMSPMSINLLCHLLCVDPEKRYTIDQALSHPFFELHQKSKTTTFSLVKKKLGRIVSRQ